MSNGVDAIISVALRSEANIGNHVTVNSIFLRLNEGADTPLKRANVLSGELFA